MKTERVISSLTELQALAAEVLQKKNQCTGAFCIALQGDLGSGKTAFVKALARELGVEEEVTSPTFVVMRAYEVSHSTYDTLMHMDAYRIESVAELEPLRFSEVLADTKTIFCIEWPEHIKGRLPHGALELTFTILHDETRQVTLSR